MSGTEIRQLSKNYILQSVGIVALMTAVGAGIGHWAQLEGMGLALLVSACFAVCVEISDAMIWRKVATDHPEGLPSFFMAVSGFRMLAAIGVLFVYYLASDRADMIVFFLVFFVFYIMLLIHHSLFFARGRKNMS